MNSASPLSGYRPGPCYGFDAGHEVGRLRLEEVASGHRVLDRGRHLHDVHLMSCTMSAFWVGHRSASVAASSWVVWPVSRPDVGRRTRRGRRSDGFTAAGVGDVPVLPLGHLAIAYLCYRLSTRARFDALPAPVPVSLVLVASLVPDLVDKPLAWYLGILPSGRSLGHSLLVLIPLATGLYLLARRYDRGEYGVAFAIGTISHSLLDITPLLWNPAASEQFLFWPLRLVAVPPVLAAFRSPLGTAYVLSELGFAVGAVALWSRDD